MENAQGSVQRLKQMDANNVLPTRLDYSGTVQATQEVKLSSVSNPSMVSKLRNELRIYVSDINLFRMI